MNARIVPAVLTATLLGLTTGCSGMRDFMFGRGARCGLCTRLSAAGQALNPLRPFPERQQGPRPCYNGPQPPGGGCGVSPQAAPYHGAGGGGYGYQGYAEAESYCGACGGAVGSGYAGGSCECGGVVSGYGSVSDPYLEIPSGGVPADNFMPRSEDVPLGEPSPDPEAN